MKKNQLKKEFKKKCKQEKRDNYKLSLIGTILSLLGFCIVFVTLFLDTKGIFIYPFQILCYVLGAIFGMVGVALDLIGEITFSKQFKEYIKTRQE